MADPKTPDIWTLLFEQTPTIIRGALGVLTLGIFTLASVLYRWHRDDLKEVHDRVDRLERLMDERHQETNNLLLQIMVNTGRDAGREK